MSIRKIRNALGLLIVDLCIIIGIFVLQFRTDSSIIQKIGNLQITLEQLTDEKDQTSLKNKLRASYNGLNIFFDDQNPVIITKNQKELPLELKDWKKINDTSFRFNFTENVALVFALDSDDPSSDLTVSASLPADASDLVIPFNFASNMKIQEKSDNNVVLDGRKNSWELEGSLISDTVLTFTQKNALLSYCVHSIDDKFSFDSIIDLPGADASSYASTVISVKSSIINAFRSNTSESNLSEQVVVSYLAAQAENGNFTAALESIPQNVRKSKQRTYLSAPYFGSLVESNDILKSAISDYEAQISRAASNGNYDIFTVKNIANFMYVHSDKDAVRKLLTSVSEADISNLSLAQITGIINVYVELRNLEPEYASILNPVLNSCIEKITEACSFQNNTITISENDTFLSVIQAVDTGVAVLRYGAATGNATLQKAGYILVNSYLSEIPSFDLRTLSNVYAILAFDNKFYPHLEKIAKTGDTKVWAWTCAKSIAYDKESDGSVSLSIDFPENWTHYVIIKGIQPFTSIYIYNMAFRTDPRFETYNSSGYVYKSEDKTLLLKSRHKSQLETVRFEYGAKEAPKSSPAPAASESTSSDSTQPAQGENANSNQSTGNSATAPSAEEPAATPDETPANNNAANNGRNYWGMR